MSEFCATVLVETATVETVKVTDDDPGSTVTLA